MWGHIFSDFVISYGVFFLTVLWMVRKNHAILALKNANDGGLSLSYFLCKCPSVN